jgi:hypothetical protein
VYLSSDEFLDLERARLTLRAHGIGADRGRLVREAIALLMTDLEAGIDASVIAKRLRAAGEPDPADGAPAAVGTAHGAPAANGAAAVNGVPAVNGGLAGGDPVAGVLANGGGVTGPPEGPQ